MASGAATLVATGGAKLCAPHIDAEGTLWALSAMTGEVLRLTQQDDGALGLTAAMHAGAAPVGIAVDEQSTYLCDVAHKAVLLVGADGAASEFVREYEQRPFVGPTALAFDGARNLFVADGGADGETGLHAPKGSVFVISAEGQLLLPLAHESLARPSALAVYPPARASPPAPAAIVFVAEQAANRIVRFVKRPVDVYVGTVFRQFAGGAGPSCLACDEDGCLFVGHFDYAPAAEAGGGRASAQPPPGRVSKLSAQGELLAEWTVPGGPELSGLALKGRTLYVTEASSNGLYAIEL